MTIEYGLFNDEGLVEGDFWSEEQAHQARALDYDEDDELEVYEVCAEHREHREGYCDE